MSLFVEHLRDALIICEHRRSSPGDELTVDTARYRALLMAQLRMQDPVPAGERQQHLIAQVRSGGLDDDLHSLADNLIEMGVVREQALLDRFLEAAVMSRLGVPVDLPSADGLVLDLALRPEALAGDGDTRLFARRYARQVGLLAPLDPESDGCASRTELGDAARRLPIELVLPFLVSLEMLSSYGQGDPWRAPREAYQLLYERGEALCARPGAARAAAIEAGGLLRAGRLRRWVRMGLCEVLPERQRPADCEYGVRLGVSGQRALHEALRSPPAVVALLCEQLFHFNRQQALAELLPRAALPMEATHVVPVPPPPPPPRPAEGVPDVEIQLDGLDDLFDPPQAPRVVPPLPSSESVDVEEVCRASLRDLQANPHYAHLGVSLTVHPGAAHVRLWPGAARRSLRLLLAEMLASAAAAVVDLPLPRILVEIVAAESEVCVLLHDNGPGIPVSQRPRVFAESEQDGEPLPRVLGAVRRVVEENLRGRIEIAAPRLGGASFRLTFPRHAQQKAA